MADEEERKDNQVAQPNNHLQDYMKFGEVSDTRLRFRLSHFDPKMSN